MLLDVRDIRFSYGEREVLQNACLCVQDGEARALMGPSGCGKTTLLQLIAGYLKPASGEILFDGQPVAGAGRERFMIFQSFDQLFPWMTLEQNLCYVQKRAFPRRSRAERTAEARACLAQAGLGDCAAQYPDALSGGMRQRGALARALVLKPRLLLLDEPFSSLDVKSRREARQTLAKLRALHKVTLLLVTHDPKEASELADRVTLWDEKRPGQTFERGEEMAEALRAYAGAPDRS